MRQGFLAVLLLFPCLIAGQQQSVPDAPTPQSSDSLNSLTSGVTPGRGTPAPQDAGPDTPQAPPPSGSQDTSPQTTAPEIPAPGNLKKDVTTFITRVNAVTVPVTVLDKKHQQVAGLTWRDFQVFENNVRQQIMFFSADAAPLSVALVIDQSLPRDVMKKVNDSMAALPGGFTASDEVAVFTYANGVNNPTDFTGAQGARLPAVLEASKTQGEELGPPISSGPFTHGPEINGLSVDPNLDTQRGNSGFNVVPKEIHTLNDAILAAGKSLQTRPKGNRRIIYVISDGKESRSKANFREVVRFLAGNQISVYGTLVGDSATWGLGYLDKLKIPLLPLSPDNILPKYTDATGGILYSEFSENGIQRSFADLAALARTQYTLGYNSHIPVLDSKYRKLEVKVTRPNLEVKAKDGYYPTATNLSR